MPISTEWVLLDNGWRLRVVCQNGVPLFLPAQWIRDVASGATSPDTPHSYAWHLSTFYKWLVTKGINFPEPTINDLKMFVRALYGTPDDGGHLFIKESVFDSTKYSVISTVFRFICWCHTQSTVFDPLFAQRRNRRAKTGILSHLGTLDLGVFDGLRSKPAKPQLPEVLIDRELRIVREWIMRKWSRCKDIQVRNRTIIEVLFDGAVRRGELLSIRLIDLGAGLIRIPYLKDDYERFWATGFSDAR